jgi:hypothetical protein
MGNNAGDFEDGQQQRYRDGADDASENGYHQGFNQSHNAFNRGPELFFVEDRDFIANFAEFAAFFPRAKHLDNAGSNQAADGGNQN